jgi:hypothetical protein
MKQQATKIRERRQREELKRSEKVNFIIILVYYQAERIIHFISFVYLSIYLSIYFYLSLEQRSHQLQIWCSARRRSRSNRV